MRTITVLLQALMFVVSITAAEGIRAQTPVSGPKGYPNKPVRLVVPYAVGGGNDLLARTLAQKLHERLGQPWIVDNRLGGGGNIGTDVVAKSPPDGYTLLLNVNALTMGPALGEPLPYDALRDLMPVAKMVTTPFILLVNPGVPANNIQQLVAYSLSNRGKFFYASPGTGTPHHLNMEWFKSITGMDAIHVAYKGASPSLADAVAGRVQVMLGVGASAMPHVKGGRLRPIATQGSQRLSYLKEVPTFDEAGVSHFDLAMWYAFFVPSATPKETVNFLHVQVMRVREDQDVRKRLSGMGFEFVPEVSPEAFLAEMTAETKHWKKFVSDKGIKFK